MLLAFTEPFFVRTTVCKERASHQQHYSQVVTVYITVQTVHSLTVSITGLPRAKRRCSLPECKGTRVYYCKKCNVGLHAECFELYHLSRAVCKMYLKVH